jgi:hypothetical protein
VLRGRQASLALCQSFCYLPVLFQLFRRAYFFFLQTGSKRVVVVVTCTQQ